jgi:hypothetical protein
VVPVSKYLTPPSIADRLHERFVQPLSIDRLRASVKPANEERCNNRAPISFVPLEHSVARFTGEPNSVGFDAPAWLETLEEEVQRVRFHTDQAEPLDLPHVAQVRLSPEEAQQQMDQWADQ